jgi:DNA helicase-2/ATP-dependent DNA helicase PcrA
VAPAGSGKTTTLVARICWLVTTGFEADRITAVTFNKRAADDLHQRLQSALEPLKPHLQKVVRVRTFHALGREILADAGVSVANLVDRGDALARINGRPLSSAQLRRLDDGFSRLKLDLCLDAESARQMLDAATVVPAEADLLGRFVAYEQWLATHEALDFDDLVRRALAVLRVRLDLLDRWRGRCAALLVDEVQDVDRSQLELALLLAGEQRNIFLVGDDDQTIYAWRLADVRRVLDLASRLPGLRRVDLVTNYRCPAPVVERAVRLVSINRERFAKLIRARTAADGQLILAPDPGDELARARRLLDRWYGKADGVFAVLARTNAQLAPFAALAVERGIPYHATDDGLLLDDPRVDELLELIERSAAGKRPAVALARVAASDHLARQMCAWSCTLPNVAAVRGAIETARAQRSVLRRDDARLVLATAHGTKGLEFDHVACIGFDEGVFPSRRTLDESDDPDRAMEEERRLAYVAWTRARVSLTIVYDPAAPSIFMREAFSDSELSLLPSRVSDPA